MCDYIPYFYVDAITYACPDHKATLVSWIEEHIEISEHLAKFAEKLLIEHLFYTISIAINKRTPGTFCHCQMRLTIRDTGVVWLISVIKRGSW